MGFYHFHAKIIGRARGWGYQVPRDLGARGASSVVAAAAYRSGTKLAEYRTGQTWDFRSKRHILHSEIILPNGAEKWMLDREKLWNSVDAREVRDDAQLAREFELGLPRELSQRARLALARDWVDSELVKRGMVADWNYHCPTARDGGEQPHVHIMATMRELHAASALRDGWGNKVRNWNSRNFLQDLRQSWADAINEALMADGGDDRVSSASYVARGLQRLKPQPKIGPRANAQRRTNRDTGKGWKPTSSKRRLKTPDPISGEQLDDLSRMIVGQAGNRSLAMSTGQGQALPGNAAKSALAAMETLNTIAPRGELDRLKNWKTWTAEGAKQIVRDPWLAVEALLADGRHVFARADLTKKIHSLTGGSLPTAEIDKLIVAVERTGRLIPLLTAQGNQRAQYTCVQALSWERAILDHATKLWARRGALIPVARSRHGRSEQERQLQYEILNGTAFCTIAGDIPGAEKAGFVRDLCKAWQRAGHRPVGASVTAKGARQLSGETGIPTYSIPTLLRSLDRNTVTLDRWSVLIVDQAQLLSIADMRRTLEFVEPANARLLLLGSDNVSASIEGISPLRMLHALGPNGAEMLDTIHHTNSLHRSATKLFRRDQFGDGFEIHHSAETFCRTDDQASAMQRVARDWVSMRSEGSALAIAATPAAARQLNQTIRAELMVRGELGDHLTSIGILNDGDDGLAGRKRALEAIDLCVGEQVVFRRADDRMDVARGAIGTVRGAAVLRNQGIALDIELADGETHRTVRVDRTQYRHLDHAYAVAVDAVHCDTSDRVTILASPNFGGEKLRSALSRHRHDVRCHWAENDFAVQPDDPDAFSRFRAIVTASPACRPAYDAMYAEGIPPHSLHAKAARSLAENRGFGVKVYGNLRVYERAHFAEIKAALRIFNDWIDLQEKLRAGQQNVWDQELAERVGRMNLSPSLLEHVLRARAGRRKAEAISRPPAVVASTPSRERGPVGRIEGGVAGLSDPS